MGGEGAVGGEAASASRPGGCFSTFCQAATHRNGGKPLGVWSAGIFRISREAVGGLATTFREAATRRNGGTLILLILRNSILEKRT